MQCDIWLGWGFQILIGAEMSAQLMFASDQAYCNEGLAVTVLQLALMMLG
jgi:hypothetical protein